MIDELVVDQVLESWGGNKQPRSRRSLRERLERKGTSPTADPSRSQDEIGLSIAALLLMLAEWDGMELRKGLWATGRARSDICCLTMEPAGFDPASQCSWNPHPLVLFHPSAASSSLSPGSHHDQESLLLRG
jgi:hypothetical protein